MMEVTVEISMYPLREDYEPPILGFIAAVKKENRIHVTVNPTATHLFGDYDLVMATVKDQIRVSFEKYGKCVFAFKVLNGNFKDSLDGKNL